MKEAERKRKRVPWKEEEFQSRSGEGHHVSGLRDRRRKIMPLHAPSGFGAMTDSRSEGLRLLILGFATFLFALNSISILLSFLSSSETVALHLQGENERSFVHGGKNLPWPIG